MVSIGVRELRQRASEVLRRVEQGETIEVTDRGRRVAILAPRRYLRRRQPLVSSALARTEVLRALLPVGDEAVARGRNVLQRLDLVRVNDRILNAAGVLLPPELRSLDAIHLATAR